MPLVNIVDGREHKYRFRKINAVVEATWHDNSCKDSDQVEYDPDPTKDGPSYEEREGISLEEAINWANTFDNPVTLYIYNEWDGFYEASEVASKKKAVLGA